MIALLQIFRNMCQRNNCKSRSIFGKDMHNPKCAVFRDTVYKSTSYLLTYFYLLTWSKYGPNKQDEHLLTPGRQVMFPVIGSQV